MGATTAVMANNAYYNNVPYGTRMYYGQQGRPYYHDDRGKEIFINEDGEVKWDNVYKADKIQDNRQQQQLAQLKTSQQQGQATARRRCNSKLQPRIIEI